MTIELFCGVVCLGDFSVDQFASLVSLALEHFLRIGKKFTVVVPCSMFVLLKGRTLENSFQIGQEIASEISAMSPTPVALKMEKVYRPCFLLTKKRYVGYSYESPGQTEPIFDAKGIETVRRDTCGAVAKTMEQSLRLFFEHQDIPEVQVHVTG